jgi:hypothetical protein
MSLADQRSLQVSRILNDRMGATWVWVCPVSKDRLPLSHGASSQSNLFVL